MNGPIDEAGRLGAVLGRLPAALLETDVERMLESALSLAVDLCGAQVGMVASVDQALPDVAVGFESVTTSPDVAKAPILAAAVGDGAPLLIDDVSRWAPSSAAAEPYGAVTDGALMSYLGSPIRGRAGDLFGSLLVAHSNMRAFGRTEQGLLAGVTAHLGAAIEQVHLLDERGRIAQALQQSLLPPLLPAVPGLELAARYRPAGPHTLVGGDFYDVFELPNKFWGVVLGDVSGVGPEAAAVTGLARYTVRAVASTESTPAGVLGRLNEAILGQRSTERFCTAVYLTLLAGVDGVEVTVASGGHPEPLVLRSDGSVEVVADAQGMLLGLYEDATFRDGRVSLAEGDALILCTDGVLEARDASGQQFGETRLIEVVASCAGRTADGIARRVELAAIDFRGGDGADDVAVLVARATRGGDG